MYKVHDFFCKNISAFRLKCCQNIKKFKKIRKKYISFDKKKKKHWLQIVLNLTIPWKAGTWPGTFRITLSFRCYIQSANQHVSQSSGNIDELLFYLSKPFSCYFQKFFNSYPSTQ